MQSTPRMRVANRRLSDAIALALVFAAPAWADVGPQSFSDGAPHTITDNIAAPGGIGLEATNTGTLVNMTGHSINADWGAEAWGDGRINLSNVDVTARNGLYAGGPGVITMTGGSIASSGGGGNAGAVVVVGTIHLNGVRITTSDGDTYGAMTLFAGNINLDNSSIATSGALSYGLQVNGGGAIAMSGGSVVTTGVDSHALWIGGGTANLTNVAVTASGANSYALYSLAGTIDASVSGQNMSGTGGLMYADTGSTIDLAASGTSRLYGTTAMNGGGTARLALSGNALWTMPDNSALTTLTLNGGTVGLAAPAAGGPYKTLTIDGNLRGSGGAFSLSANPNGGMGDLISVGGTASGAHGMAVRILGGTPADLHQVVKVVDLVNEAGAHTATFSGGGDVGAYRYGVARGAALPAGYSGVGSLADIYLYNTFAPSTPARAAVSTAASPGVLWYGEMNDIKKRLGELRLGRSAENLWVRTHAGKYIVEPGGGQRFDQDSRGLEIGGDKPAAIDGGTRSVGWVAGVARADNSFAAGGSGASDSVYVGAYGSWLREDGAYVDVVAKHNWFRHAFSAPVLGGGSDSAAYRTTGVGVSIEVGKRFERADGIFIEPQVELAALRSQGKRYVTTNGLHVAAPASTSRQVRLGAAAGRKTLVDGGSRQAYGKLSWIEELAGQIRTTVDMASFDSSLKGGRLVVGFGIMEDSASRQIYLDIETARGKPTRQPWGLNLGCRWKF